MNLRAVGLTALLLTPLISFTFAADPAPAPGAAVHTKSSAPLHVSHGAEIQLADYAVTGKTTVFDFYSEYCPPCRAIAPHLEALHSARPDLAVVKVDINRPGHRGIDWKSPVAAQYQLRSVPHFAVYGPDGKLAADGDEAYEMVVSLIKASEKS
jgi:thiol-disulfide isomerase/thioredoxin